MPVNDSSQDNQEKCWQIHKHHECSQTIQQHAKAWLTDVLSAHPKNVQPCLNCSSPCSLAQTTRSLTVVSKVDNNACPVQELLSRHESSLLVVETETVFNNAILSPKELISKLVNNTIDDHTAYAWNAQTAKTSGAIWPTRSSIAWHEPRIYCGLRPRFCTF